MLETYFNPESNSESVFLPWNSIEFPNKQTWKTNAQFKANVLIVLERCMLPAKQN